ncbi:MAG: hypothetical protein R3325_11680, partial [Thermoanaerobaculia bacterium]|nr:hypothetical protein [Thermoanaerobaculia bacterium]
MSARGVAQAVRLFAALLLVAAAVTLSPLPRTGTEGAPAAAAGVRLADLAGVESAARAARDGDCQAARELAPASGAGEAPVLLAGLYALECGRPSRARELLTAAGGDDADLEDLRLYALAEAATAAGDPLAALATADLLVERFPASPLSGPVRVVAAEAASRGALPGEALTRIDAALAADPGREARRRLAARG